MENELPKLWGLVGGSKIGEYSIAPHMWKSLFKLKNKKIDYFVLGEDKSSAISLEMQDYLANPNFIGANIALPWKHLGYEFCDYVEDVAARMDTVNTIIRKDGRTEGYNTDGIGLVNAITKITDIKNKKVLLLGSGSSAQTVPAHLVNKGVGRIYVTDIIESRAKNLSRKYSDQLEITPIKNENIYEIIKDIEIIINATPCGMQGFKKNFPIEKELIEKTKQGCLFVEAVYNPLETPLLKYAKEKGKKICPGINMLVEQAAESYYLAFNEKLSDSDIEYMKLKAKEALNKKTILITGASGFVGEYLSSKFRNDYEIIGLDLKESEKKYFKKFYNIDLSNTDEITKIFNENRIDFVIHCAAEKNLKWCEENRDKSYDTNFLASKNIYEIANSSGSKFIFLSSDQVFDGKSSNYKENDVKHPINHYGTLKDLFEEFLTGKKNIAICRTAMVFGKIPENQKKYFDQIKDHYHLVVQGYIVDHVIHKLKNKEKIYLPANEYCNPTSNYILYSQIKSIIDKNLVGTFHCCGGERVSRFDFGKKIALLFGLDDNFIDPRSSKEVLRPKDVSMDFTKSEMEIGFKFPKLNDMIKKEWNLE